MLFFRKKNTSDLSRFFRNVLGYTPRNEEIYKVALTHKSMSQEIGNGHKINNERLEYLGDAVLSAVVADYLYQKFPYQGEGFLTEMRSKMVSRASLNKLSRKLGLDDLVICDHHTNNISKSMGGNTFEALVGAIYIDRGFRFTKKVLLHRVFSLHMDLDEVEKTTVNYKGKLIDWGQKRSQKVTFETVRVINNGKHERKQFECRALIAGKPAESGIDYTIKGAEQIAAMHTLEKLPQETAE